MEHRATTMNVPPRIGSAPLVTQQSQNTALNRNHRPLSRPGMEKHVNTSASPPTAAGFFERAAPQTELGSNYPESCIYDINEFMKLQSTKESPPKGIFLFVEKLWKEMPENKDSRPEHIFSREDVFQGGESALSSKVLKERKLHNEVLGILGRVCEESLAKMKKELTDLPIRQSTREEIQEVIQVFFNKSIQPEDAIFTPLYVKLIVHLISSIGESEVAGRFIREAIIRQCQYTFENADEHQEQLEREIKDLPPEEAELRRNIFAGKQKANINFLGLLFTHGLVREKVVAGVLQGLLYGRERRRRIPADYELIHFMSLLITCGKSLAKEGLELVPQFRAVMEELVNTYPQRRIQFLLLNAVETMDNGWEPCFGAKAAERGDTFERRPLPPIPPRHKALAVPVQKSVGIQDFWEAMDNFFVTSSVDMIVSLLNNIPPEARTPYCTSAIGRYITNVRYAQQRARLGELFDELANKRVLPLENVREALLAHMRTAVQEDIFTDVPKYFSFWAAVVKGRREVFPPSLHTEFLNILVDNGVSREHIVDMVKSVHKVQNEGILAAGRETDAKDRFRVLPALLRYTPPLLVGCTADESEDILKQLRDYDSEVEFFDQLCEQVDSKEVFLHTTALVKCPHFSVPILSAFFTYIRFDVEALCHAYKDTLKKLLNTRTLTSLLEEVYVTWQALQRVPEQSFFHFAKVLQKEVCSGKDQKGANTSKEQIDKFKQSLTKNYGALGKKDAAALEKILK